MGGKSAPAPDYSGMEQVAREQLSFAREQYQDFAPVAQEIMGLQMQAQQQQMDQAADYYDYQQSTFRPLEQGLVQRAQEMDTEAYRQQQAAQASAAAARAFSTSDAMNRRAMAARGVNPASGAARGASNATGLQQAAMRAQAMTGARQAAEDRATAAQYQAAGLGRGLATNSLAAFQGATGAGTAAGNMGMAAGNQYQAGLAGAGSTFGQMASTQASLYGQKMGIQAEMLGTALGAGTAAAFSDRRLKTNIEKVGADENTGLTLYSFNYIESVGQDGTFIGVLADEVMEDYPEAVLVMDNGYYAVDYDKLGIELQTVGEA